MNAPTVYLAVLSEWHIVLLVLVIFLLFGGKKLPELAKGMGEAMREFKRASREDADDNKSSSNVSAAPTQQSESSKSGKPTPPGGSSA